MPLITGGIGKLVASKDPDAPDKIRQADTGSQLPLAMCIALLDDSAADKRKPNRGNG